MMILMGLVAMLVIGSFLMVLVAVLLDLFLPSDDRPHPPKASGPQVRRVS